MAQTIAFDTLQYVKRAREAGLDEKQAEFQAEEMADIVKQQNEQLVTKEFLQTELREFGHKLVFKIVSITASIIVSCVGISTTILGIIIHVHG